MIGQVLLNYKILEELGAGGQGTVYKAIDLTLDRTVAIKILPPELTEKTLSLLRFEREAKLASSLDHPNICTIYGLHKADDVQFIAMQYVEGSNVRQLVDGKPLELRSALSIAIQVADALAAAHSRGIIHRDIKAGNVMVTKSGLVKVLDFGLAKLMEPEREGTSDSHLTEFGVPYGTATYAAPEQAQGQPVDHRADIFSTGVLLYEMLTGSWPFRGKTAVDVRYAVLHATPIPIARSRPEPAASLRHLQETLDRALAKEPGNRFQQIEEFRDALEIDFKENGNTSTGPTHGSGGRARVPARQIQPVSRPRLWWTRKTAFAASAVVLIALVALAIYFVLARRKQAEAFDSLAVLPFYTSGAAPDTEYLSDGITESLITSLSQLPYLKVRSRNTAFHYKGQKADPGTIGKELGVRALLTGGVVSEGDSLTINVELISAQDGSRLWGRRYAGNLSDMVSLPARIALDVADKLQLRVTGADQKQLVSNYAIDSEAYRLYLLGRYNWNKRTAEGVAKGIDYFNQAIAKDPNYPLAYTGLADCHALQNVYNVAAATDGYPKAKAAAERALQLNEKLPEAHASLAFVSYRYGWDWALAEEHFKRAIALKPDYATAHQWYSGYLAALGRHREALAEARRAHELEPFSVTIYADLVRNMYYARLYDEAISECRKLIEMEPGFARGHIELGQLFEQRQRFPEAVGEFQKAISLSQNSQPGLTGLGHAYALEGNRSEAERIIKQLETRGQKQYVSPYNTAVVYAGLGDKQQAVSWLQKARAERFNLVAFVDVDPLFDGLRSERGFMELVKSMGLEP